MLWRASRSTVVVSKNLTRSPDAFFFTKSLMMGNVSNKRRLSSDKGNTKDNNKKPTPATRQMSILSMFKPKAAAAKEEDNVDSLQVASTTAKNPRDLFPNLDKELETLLELELTTMHYEWVKALKDEFTKPYFIKLKKFIQAEKEAKKEIYPPAHQIYSWSNFTPLSRVKVVIIGQDPYINKNQAHGLCFSVVKGVAIPPSLVNIYQAIQNDYPDFEKPDHGYLENWAKQGVLLLNTSLTVEAGKPASHADKGWEQLTDAVISTISEKKAHVVFMLWGAHAQRRASKINKSKHLILKSVHPSPLSAYRGFLTCGHFKQANEYLKQNAREPINWNCLT